MFERLVLAAFIISLGVILLDMSAPKVEKRNRPWAKDPWRDRNP